MKLDNLLNHGYALSRKPLWPTNFEKKIVKLVLQIFNSNLSKDFKNWVGGLI